jgi:ABC transport system permease protein
MSQLSLIIKNEYLTDVRGKSFWISTLLVPVIIAAFGLFGGIMASQSESMGSVVNDLPITPEAETMTAQKAAGMFMGMFLAIFLMMYGAMIFTKVKTEKTNRIVEILATCVDGRTMMLAKIIAVGLVGLTQLLVWALLAGAIIVGVFLVFTPDISFGFLMSPKVWLALLWTICFFIGGYIFFGSLYAAAGAMTDKDNENQAYMSILTFMLLGSFYIGEFAVDHGDSAFARVCSYIPFTSPTIGCVNAVTETAPLWETALSLILLYAFAVLALVISGKIYSSSLLLRGKNFTPKDIVTFLKAK